MTHVVQAHTGTDYRASTGTPLRAATAGTVVRSTYDAATAGNYVRIDVGGGVWIGYSHLSRRDVEVGDRVKAGEVIGLAGSTGSATAAHLHFEVSVDGTKVDPVPFLAARTAGLVSNPGGGSGGGTLPNLPPIKPVNPLVPEEDIVASREDLKTDLNAALAPVLAAITASRTVRAYRIAGTDGAYFDYGLGRAALTAERLATLDPEPAIRTLPADDPFWSLPLYGPPSQAFRKAGDRTGAVFYVEDGELVHVDAARYARDGKPPLKDLPTTHPVWALPTGKR